ncbi:hypothetical protein Bbelb_135100 [Branchiostoma belcheri]|nr:hypothetical protein Bbelb_135100 [Branchiostoma belcheri]
MTDATAPLTSEIPITIDCQHDRRHRPSHLRDPHHQLETVQTQEKLFRHRRNCSDTGETVQTQEKLDPHHQLETVQTQEKLFRHRRNCSDTGETLFLIVIYDQ